MKNRIIKVLNHTEENIFEILTDICLKHNCKIFTKVRVADIIIIQNSGIRNELYTYALSAHFDFLICDFSSFPLFAVEFDGPLHNNSKQQHNDCLKDELGNYFEFPILRVYNNYNYAVSNELNYLAWLVECYFAYQDFEKEKKFHKDLNPYEIFAPSIVYSIDEYKSEYPLCPSFKIRSKFFRMHLDNLIYSFSPIILIFKDINDTFYHSLGYLQLSENEFVISRFKLKNNSFFEGQFLDNHVKSFYFSELLTELTMTDLFSKTECILNNASSDTLCESKLENLKQRYNKNFIWLGSR